VDLLMTHLDGETHLEPNVSFKSATVAVIVQGHLASTLGPSPESEGVDGIQSFGGWMDNTDELMDLDDSVPQFAAWAIGKWDVLRGLFAVKDSQYVSGSRHKVNLREFSSFMWSQDFEGDVARVYREIQRRGPQETARVSTPVTDTLDQDAGITVAQLLCFEKQCQTTAANLDRGVEGSPISRLVKLLKEKRGCTLRAFRMDLDVRADGKVTQADFVNACRGRTLNIPTEANHIWTSLRPGSSQKEPLELSDFDAEEASNVYQFAEVIWATFGFDLDRAWAFIDPSRRTVVSMDEFVQGVKNFGFQGNAKLLFRGLDCGGLGHLKRTEFEYMNVFIKTNCKVNYNAPFLRDLASWVESWGGADSFLIELGFEEVSKAGVKKRTQVGLTVCDLAARLTALGYPGDAFQVSVAAARKCGGAMVMRGTFQELLEGRRAGSPPRRRTLNARASQLRACQLAEDENAPCEWTQASPGTEQSLASSPDAKSSPQSKTVAWRPRKVWKDSVDNVASANDAKPRMQRNYFSVPQKTMGLAMLDATAHMVQSECPRPSSPCRSVSPKVDSNRLAASASSSPTRPQAFMVHKPAWNNTIDHSSEVNSRKPIGTRRYFGGVEQPVKDDTLKELTWRKYSMKNKKSASQPLLQGALDRMAVVDATSPEDAY